MDDEAFEGELRIVGGGGERIDSIRDWRRLGAPASDTHWKRGRSAYQAALAWLSLAPLLKLLSTSESTRGFRATQIQPEALLKLDDHRGRTRQTDVLVHGTADSGRVILGVEAKADESFGSSLATSLEGASEGSNLPARIDQLCRHLFGRPFRSDETGEVDPDLSAVRYQLVHACVGIALEADRSGVPTAALVVHEFRTDETDDRLREKNAVDWTAFLGTAGVKVPHDGTLVDLPVDGIDCRLLAGKAVSDLREED